jgi:Sulfotransferase family
MEAVAQSQQVQRWAVYDPDNVLHIERVKRDIPNALFVHIIRDGRDIALSLKKMGGFTPLPWDRNQTESLVATSLYWEWMVHKGRAHGRKFPADYVEIRYEDLIGNPRETLGKLGRFLDHDLDYDQIQRASLGRLSETNSSFREEGAKETIKPLGRWKERLVRADVAAIEATVGQCLEENGYELSLPAAERRRGLRQSWMRGMYPAFLGSKLWLKLHTPVGRLANMSALELEEEPMPVAESVRP